MSSFPSLIASAMPFFLSMIQLGSIEKAKKLPLHAEAVFKTIFDSKRCFQSKKQDASASSTVFGQQFSDVNIRFHLLSKCFSIVYSTHHRTQSEGQCSICFQPVDSAWYSLHLAWDLNLALSTGITSVCLAGIHLPGCKGELVDLFLLCSKWFSSLLPLSLPLCFLPRSFTNRQAELYILLWEKLLILWHTVAEQRVWSPWSSDPITPTDEKRETNGHDSTWWGKRGPIHSEHLQIRASKMIQVSKRRNATKQQAERVSAMPAVFHTRLPHRSVASFPMFSEPGPSDVFQCCSKRLLGCLKFHQEGASLCFFFSCRSWMFMDVHGLLRCSKLY